MAAPRPSPPGMLGTSPCPGPSEYPPRQDAQATHGAVTAAKVAHRPGEPRRGRDGRLDPAGQPTVPAHARLRPGRWVRPVVLADHQRRRGVHRGVEYLLDRLTSGTGARPGDRRRPELIEIADEVVPGAG